MKMYKNFNEMIVDCVKTVVENVVEVETSNHKEYLNISIWLGDDYFTLDYEGTEVASGNLNRLGGYCDVERVNLERLTKVEKSWLVSRLARFNALLESEAI